MADADHDAFGEDLEEKVHPTPDTAFDLVMRQAHWTKIIANTLK